MTTIERAAPAKLARRVEEEIARRDVPGLALGVLRDGEVQAWGFGVASIETRQPVTPETLFQVGSITKVFTTTVVMVSRRHQRAAIRCRLATQNSSIHGFQ